MVELTVEVPEEMVERIRPLGPWLSTVLELGLIGFQTPATATASEVVQFLARGPSPLEVLDYHASDTAQARLRRLLTLNEAGLLGEAEQRELDELQRIEHAVILLKARAAAKARTP